MSWKIRHQGSPKAVEGLSLEQVIDGVKDGVYERSAEVQGPGETTWTSFESHELFEDMSHEMEEAEKGEEDVLDPEEQRIDMNPLIDVCLVLLVFFILATTMQVLEKVLDIPANRVKKEQKTKQIPKDALDSMVFVKVRLKEGKAAYEVDKQNVPEADLNRFVQNLKRTQNKQEMIIDASNEESKGVDWGSIVKLIDSAAYAGIKKVHFVAASNVVTE